MFFAIGFVVFIGLLPFGIGYMGMAVPNAGIWTISDGYRFGKLVSCQVKGIIIRSTECTLMLGDGSDIQSLKDGDPYQINPWYFSARVDDIVELEKLAGKTIWVHYDQAAIKWPWFRETSYYPLEFAEVTGQTACSINGDGSGVKATGTIGGQLAKVSSKGYLIKTDEVIVHEGGKKFSALSISDSEVTKCAIQWVKSGKNVSISYRQKWINWWHFEDTDLRIYKLGS